MSSASQRELKTQKNSLEQPLIQSQHRQQVAPTSSWKKFKQYFLKEVQDCKRVIRIGGQVQPINYQNNLVKNTKYNIISFVPKVLYNQFKFFFNLFFLVTALTQLIQVLRVGLFITFIGPLIMVLALTMAKQAWDDFHTFKRDIQANSKQYNVIRPNGQVLIKSKDLRVGDIIKLQGGDRIPADLIVLHSDNDQGTLFLKTDQLDGQTDWKLRKAVKMTQSILSNPQSADQIWNMGMFCQAKAPEGQIYAFGGVFNGEGMSERLTLQNTMWATTVLTNGNVIGLVVYVGRETRISMGGSSARTKFGILDMQINYLSKVLFLIMVCLTTAFVLLQKTQIKYLGVQFMRMLILLSSIIPISMRVNLDFAKLFYSYLINKDTYIQGAVTRNSNCPQELGRVKYILSDKTGTLTQNQMIFRQISIDDDTRFTDDQEYDIKNILSDYQNIPEAIFSKQKALKNIITALILCHNVTPVFNEDRTKKDFQASSPDQITFVKAAQSYGLSIEQRTQNSMKIKLPNSTIVDYEIKYTFPFKSQTKRMGIILRNCITGQISFYLKGADTIMKDFILSKQKKAFIQEQCRDLSMTGLRTLVLSRKILTKQFFDKWSNQYQYANNRLQIDVAVLNKLMKELQAGVQFLGITGIQDKLQNNLKSTIESVRSGGIKVWMITGDKMETAQCIGRSCGLQKTTQNNFKIQQVNNIDVWNQKLNIVANNLHLVLIIDGKTLTFVLQNKQIADSFFKIAMKLPAVICCRCSPSQKKILTQGVKARKSFQQSVLGIGDGGNDVGMIQAADCGIGIVGKQGMQAALAADFSIKQFRDLKALLFWHGRLSYIRSSLLASFIIHRGFIVSAMQLIFSCIFYYVSIPVFNSYLQLGYATIFTFWPVFALILDKDINFENAMRFPKLYNSLQSKDFLSLFNFLVWLWKACFQATIIIILTLIIFQQQSYLQFQTVTFTILILTQYFMTFSQITKLHYYLIFCVIGSLLSYLICLIFLNQYLHVSYLTFTQVIYIFAIFGVSWAPLFIWKIIRKRLWPTDVETIMKTAKQKLVNRDLFGSAHERDPTSNLYI